MNGNIDEKFWKASVKEIIQGYIYEDDKEEFTCLICGKSVENGIIYKDDDMLLEAKKAIKRHIVKEHNTMFDYLINLNKKYTGITEHQKELLEYFHHGLSDKEIIAEQGVGSTATVRNHRFKLKEKEKQTKIFLAIMSLLNRKDEDENEKKFVNIHKGARMVDERYAITEAEREKVLRTYFTDDMQVLNIFPRKEKRKIVILQYFISKFEINKKYTEKEVNEIIKTKYADFVTIRRYLIEYGFMDRNKDGSSYWVKL